MERNVKTSNASQSTARKTAVPSHQENNFSPNKMVWLINVFDNTSCTLSSIRTISKKALTVASMTALYFYKWDSNNLSDLFAD